MIQRFAGAAVENFSGWQGSLRYIMVVGNASAG